MPYKARQIQRLYHSIGDVAYMFDVSTSLIRFYEKEFDLLHPKKSSKGNRMYTNDDIEKFKLIFHLVKEKGFTINGAKEHLKNNTPQLEIQQKTLATLDNVKKFLLNLRDQL